jgi:hypothetical protein
MKWVDERMGRSREEVIVEGRRKEGHGMVIVQVCEGRKERREEICNDDI